MDIIYYDFSDNRILMQPYVKAMICADLFVFIQDSVYNTNLILLIGMLLDLPILPKTAAVLHLISHYRKVICDHFCSRR